MHFGSFMHKVFELGYKCKTLEELTAIADEQRSNHSFNDSFEPKKIKALKNFFNWNQKLGETLGVEIVYETPLCSDANQNGVIDRIVKGSDDGLLIIDYKLGKREKTKVELYTDNQLKGYDLWAMNEFKKAPDKIWCALYYPITDSFVSIQYSLPQLNRYRQQMINEIWDIRKMKMNDMKPTRNNLCDWCSYQEYCPLFTQPNVASRKLDEAIIQRKKSKKDK